MKKIVFLCFLQVCSLIFATEKLTYSENTILSKCFESILECEAGYVFYGKKPICILEYFENSFFFEPREFHQRSVAICVARSLLKRPLFHSGNIIFHFDEKDETLLIINKKLFLKTIQDNIVLFQYVLGPSITPQRLLAAITNDELSFCEVLNYDRVLIGIALGYGVQNSIYQARYENILCDLVVNKDVPPFIPNITFFPTESCKEDLLFLEKNSRELWAKNRKFLNPTNGHTSLAEECEKIQEILTVSSTKLQEKPYFIFGCLKDSKENKVLLDELEHVQKQIRKLVQSKSLVKDVLALVCNERVLIDHVGNLGLESEKEKSIDLETAMAKLLRNGLREYDKKYIPYFTEGLRGVYDLDDSGNILSLPKAVEQMQKAKWNLEQTNYLFKKLKENPAYHEIMDQLLYYEVLTQGGGEALKEHSYVLVDYEIFDPNDHQLVGESGIRLDLTKALPALMHGMQGMKRGEKRVFFIHPSLAYGVHTFLKKGIYLKLIVTMHDMFGPLKSLSPVIPNDLSFILSEGFQQQCEQEHQRALRFMGAQRRAFLKTFSNLNIDLLIQIFQNLDTYVTLTQEESDALNQSFWNIYFMQA